MSKVNFTKCFLVLLLLLSACSKPAPIYQEQAYVFGTLVEISIVGESDARARLATSAVIQEFQRLHNLLHAWKASELSALNTAISQKKTLTVSPEIFSILQSTTQISTQSDGLFNPSIGGLIQIWGFQADEFKAVLPDQNSLQRLLVANPKMTDLIFGDDNKISSRNSAVQLDLGGYAKGYALDRAADILKQLNIHNALVNIGGNVLAIGKHGDRDWRVGIQHPRKPGPLATLTLHDGDAIGTSGDYQRFFEINGKRYCHLIDPRDGYPVQGVQAVTILTHGKTAGLLSDASSKPLFIAGVTGWRAAAQQMKISEALLIDDRGVVHLTTTMHNRLEFTDQTVALDIQP